MSRRISAAQLASSANGVANQRILSAEISSRRGKYVGVMAAHGESNEKQKKAAVMAKMAQSVMLKINISHQLSKHRNNNGMAP
jgi:hypothetical protein